jgi:hypothetical protein
VPRGCQIPFICEHTCTQTFNVMWHLDAHARPFSSFADIARQACSSSGVSICTFVLVKKVKSVHLGVLHLLLDRIYRQINLC